MKSSFLLALAVAALPAVVAVATDPLVRNGDVPPAVDGNAGGPPRTPPPGAPTAGEQSLARTTNAIHGNAGHVAGAPQFADLATGTTSTPLHLDGQHVDAGATRARTVLLLRSGGDSGSALTCVSAVLIDAADSLARPAILPGDAPCSANSRKTLVALDGGVTPVPVTIQIDSRRSPFTGYLVAWVRTDAVATSIPLVRPIRVTVPAPLEPNAGWMVVGALGASAVCVIVVGLVHGFSQAITATTAVGTPEWDPKTSWASTAGLWTTFVSAAWLALLPEQPHFVPRATYSLLALVFTALIGLASPIAGLLGSAMSSGADGRTARALAVVATLASSLVTLWGAFGALALAWAVFGELRWAGLLPPSATLALQGLVMSLAVLLVLYAIRAATAAVRGERAVEPAAGAPRGGFARPAAPRFSLL